ncbi:thiamine diphosphate-binding protein [Xylogone sp. PMI_703]|nr:thiamine diphosphate-binding protein [Xylogone sp. PMI_703]
MAQDLDSKKTLKVAEYLFTRLHQLGIRSLFGVPGDYNLRLLDYVVPSGLHWVGNCNELNAAYSADGYARVQRLGALVTTFGVGELSALNGIAGAYAEKAPVIHIVGTPSREIQDTRRFMHHAFDDGDYRRFAAMSTHITVAQANLVDPRTIPEQIDWILQQALLHSRPVYLAVPDDIVDVQVSASNLESNISIPSFPASSQDSQILSQVLHRIYSAKQPLLFVDGETRALGVIDEVNTLVEKTSWPTWTSVFGKGLINEQLPNVYGFYGGAFGDKESKSYFESADLIISIGPHYSDTNSLSFSAIPNPSKTVTISSNLIRIGDATYRDTSKGFLSQLLQNLDYARVPKITGPEKPAINQSQEAKTNPDKLITQDGFYRTVNPLFREGDIILTETGTAAHGGRGFSLPPNTRFFTAVTWLSIGYMLPATLGAALAQREKAGAKSRAILFIGDGSLQMTVQEISTMIKEDLNIIIFIINNEGYTIERVIHGRKQVYNDVAAWNHTHALRLFGADEEHAQKNMFTARTWAELQNVIDSKPIQEGNGVRIVEVFMGREDAQGVLLWLLKNQIAGEEKEGVKAT